MMAKDTKEEVKVVSPNEVQEVSQDTVKETNSNVDKAGEEAAKVLEGKEAANTIDSILGQDEKHGDAVAKAQAATNGDPDFDPVKERERKEKEEAITPAPSQNQNNLKHREDDVSTDPLSSRNYLGQVI